MAKALLILDAQSICPTRPRPDRGWAANPKNFPTSSGEEVAIPLLATARVILQHGGTVFAARGRAPGVSTLCVHATSGVEPHPRLRLPKHTVVVSPSNGGDRLLDRRNRAGHSLRELLGRNRFSEVFVGGMTTRGELRSAVADLREGGLPTTILADAVFALDAAPGERPSMAGFTSRGARIVSAGQAIMEQYGWRDEYPAPHAETVDGGAAGSP